MRAAYPGWKLRSRAWRVLSASTASAASENTAAVSPSATPAYLIGEMVTAGFLHRPERVGQYKLRDARSSIQLLDTTTLQAAGVEDNATLLVDHTTTGA